MGYFNRFVLFIFALAVALFALGVAVLCLNLIPQYMLINEFRYVLSRQETLIAAGIVFLFSVYLIGCSFYCGSSKPKSEKDIILLQGASGVVKLSSSAVKNMVEKTAASLAGVREAKAVISAQNKGAAAPLVMVQIEAILGPEENVVAVSDSVKAAVSRDLEQVAGISDHDVSVLVKDISSSAVSKKKRVV